jgi:phage-related protein
VLRDLKHAQQNHRRLRASSKWRLYETPTGNVPKDLVTMFAGIPTPQIPSPPAPILTAGERGELAATLGFIDRHGARRLLSVTAVNGEATPRTEKVKAAKGPLIELKIKSAEHNPRFLLVDCSDVAVFLSAFMKKTRKLARADIDRADKRYRTMKDECR